MVLINTTRHFTARFPPETLLWKDMLYIAGISQAFVSSRNSIDTGLGGESTDPHQELAESTDSQVSTLLSCIWLFFRLVLWLYTCTHLCSNFYSFVADFVPFLPQFSLSLMLLSVEMSPIGCTEQSHTCHQTWMWWDWNWEASATGLEPDPGSPGWDLSLSLPALEVIAAAGRGDKRCPMCYARLQELTPGGKRWRGWKVMEPFLLLLLFSPTWCPRWTTLHRFHRR